MRDVVKTPPSKQNGRRRRRRKNLSLYYLMIIVISGLVIYTLAKTVLFRINEYVVVGNERYSENQILNAGNLSIGRNMYNINTEKTAQKIKETLIYVENVTVKRKLPDKMIVTVEEARPFACCKYEGTRYAVVSRNGRYLETEQASARTELIQIYGLDLIEVTLGSSLESEDPNKISIVMELLDTIDEVCPGEIEYIDISNRTDIVMGYGGRIDIEFGSTLDYVYKMKYIKAIIDKLEPDAAGRIIYHSASAGASFVTNEDYEEMKEELERNKSHSDQPVNAP